MHVNSCSVLGTVAIVWVCSIYKSKSPSDPSRSPNMATPCRLQSCMLHWSNDSQPPSDPTPLPVALLISQFCMPALSTFSSAQPHISDHG